MQVPFIAGQRILQATIKQIALTDFGYGILAGKRNPNKEKYPAEPFDLFGNKKQIQENNKIKKRRENQANLNFWARIRERRLG